MTGKHELKGELIGVCMTDNEPIVSPQRSIIDIVQDNGEAGFVFEHQGLMCTTGMRTNDVIEQTVALPDPSEEVNPYVAPPQIETREEAVRAIPSSAQKRRQDKIKERVKITYDQDDELLLLF